MNEDQIMARLNEITSYFSFGRLLGLRSYSNIGLGNNLEYNQLPNNKRLMLSESDFLSGLWVQNVILNKSWEKSEDFEILSEVCDLMERLRLCYLGKGSIESRFVEVFFYEGDMGYEWQYIDFAHKKYNDEAIIQLLKEDFSYNTKVVASTYRKIKEAIKNKISRLFVDKRKRLYDYSPVRTFTIKPNTFMKCFTMEEQGIIKALSLKLGDKDFPTLKAITDYNKFCEKPIIELPNGGGYFFPNLLAVAISMNESPYYWLLESSFSKEKLGSIRGYLAESIVIDIVKKRFENNVHARIPIKKTKSSNVITDIDALIIYKNYGVVFQIKSKRLSLSSKRGNLITIREDTRKAILEAYHQGEKCIDCLKNSSQYYTLKRELGPAENLAFINVCVTLDAFPGISTFTYGESFMGHELPLLAMSLYDLDTIFYLFRPETIINYFAFRMECVRHNIYGLNEIFYIGLFMGSVMGGRYYY